MAWIPSFQHTLSLSFAVQVDGPHLPVVYCRMVLTEVVCQVGGAWAPVDVVLALVNTILEPIKTHVDGLGASLLDGSGEDALRREVVGLQGCGGLIMAEVLEYLAQWAGLLGVDVGGADFGFGRRSHHIAHDLDDEMDGAVDERAVEVTVA